jgi:hypothetical protein
VVVAALVAVVIVHSASGRRQALSGQRERARDAGVLLNLDLRGDALVYGSHLRGDSTPVPGLGSLTAVTAGTPPRALATRAGALRVAAAAAHFGDNRAAIENLRGFPDDPTMAALAEALSSDEESPAYALALNEASKLNPLWVRRALRMALLKRGSDAEAESAEEALILAEAPSRLTRLAVPGAFVAVSLCPGVPVLLVVVVFGLFRWLSPRPQATAAAPEVPSAEPVAAVTLLDGCEAAAAFLAAQVVMAEALAALPWEPAIGRPPVALVAALSYGGAMLAAAAMLRWRLGPGFLARVGYVRSKPWRVYATVTVAVPALAGAFMLANLVMQSLGLSPVSENPAQWLTVRESDVLSRAILLVLMVVGAPIAEEALFRGALYLPVRRRLGVAPAVLITAALFSVAHRDPTVAPQLALIGVACAIAREVSGSLAAPALLHAVWNGVTFLLLSVMSS